MWIATYIWIEISNYLKHFEHLVRDDEQMLKIYNTFLHIQYFDKINVHNFEKIFVAANKLKLEN